MPEYPTGQPGVTYTLPAFNQKGAVRPEGAVVAPVGGWYIFDDGTNFEWYYKETDDGLNTGWIMRQKLK